MILQQYNGDGYFDEMTTGPSGVRAHYARFLHRFSACSDSDFEQKRRAVAAPVKGHYRGTPEREMKVEVQVTPALEQTLSRA
jgi:hypothetical protein